eukprot:scaffold3515_cov126-Cylindrotheca_fusiformis.AAC.6
MGPSICLTSCKLCHDLCEWERPYQHDSTASRPLSEVKHVRACFIRWTSYNKTQAVIPPNFEAPSKRIFEWREQMGGWTDYRQKVDGNLDFGGEGQTTTYRIAWCQNC